MFTTGPGSNTSFPADSAWHVIATLDIPADEAGQYLVMFSAGLYNSFSDRFAYGGCRIQTPTVPSPGFGWTIGAAHPSPAVQATTFVTATVPVSLEAGGAIDLACVGSISTGVSSATLTASQVTDLVEQ